MPELIQCPKCDRQLRVPDNLLGKKVKCPSCAITFTATAAPRPEEEAEEVVKPRRRPPEPEEEAEIDEEDEAPLRRRRSRPEEEDDDAAVEEEDVDDRPRRRKRRRPMAPHRGGMILTFGILAFVCFGPIFGPLAWIMGNNDMAEIRAGRMDRSGEGTTNAGRICGIIATILSVLGIIFYAVIFAVALATGVRG